MNLIQPKLFQTLLNLLAENRQITVSQYDRLIKYLLERKDLQRQQENLDDEERKSKLQDSDVIDSKQAELQSRIMTILNKSSGDDSKIITASSPASSVNSNSKPTPLLNDPSVQKALDSLLSGDMFKSIATGK